jgi:two-component system invasion response regulator UvrY
MLRIVVVDDHPVVREGLKRILSEHNEITVAAEAGDGVEAVDVVRRTPCDVVLLDVKLPSRSGLDVLKQLHAEMPRLPVLMLSMYSEDQYAMRVLRAGAAGYLTKESAPANLVQAVRRVARGGKYVSTAFAERLASSLERDTDRPPHEILSDREYQVLCMLSSGKTVGQIAAELCRSVKTISTYRARVLDKLQLQNNAELTRYALTHGLVD